MNRLADDEAIRREQLRQQLLMDALRRRDVRGVAGWLRPLARANAARGLLAHAANADEHAARALAARYPTVQRLLGEDTFAQVAARHPDGASAVSNAPDRGADGWGNGVVDTIDAGGDSSAVCAGQAVGDEARDIAAGCDTTARQDGNDYRPADQLGSYT